MNLHIIKTLLAEHYNNALWMVPEGETPAQNGLGVRDLIEWMKNRARASERLNRLTWMDECSFFGLSYPEKRALVKEAIKLAKAAK